MAGNNDKPRSLGQWQFVKSLGSGGQGEVFLVCSKKRTDGIKNTIQKLGSIYKSDEFQPAIDLVQSIQEFSSNLGALKLLKNPDEKAKQRLKIELNTLQSCNHPSLVKILDSDLSPEAFVMTYLPNGTLSDQKEIFQGNVLKSLIAFRGIVEAVGELHQKSFVHRDIKPDNIFIGEDGNLILGDCGIVRDLSNKERPTETYENAGSMDWQPPWSFGLRIDVKPNFDNYCLGKVLWAMISPKKMLPLWYFQRPENDLVKLFPNNPEMVMVNDLLGKSIVENESDCLSDAKLMLNEVNILISKIQTGEGDLIPCNEKPCVACGRGKYSKVTDMDITGTHNFGLSPSGTSGFKIFSCDHCGHLQMFHIKNKHTPPTGMGVK